MCVVSIRDFIFGKGIFAFCHISRCKRYIPPTEAMLTLPKDIQRHPAFFCTMKQLFLSADIRYPSRLAPVGNSKTTGLDHSHLPCSIRSKAGAGPTRTPQRLVEGTYGGFLRAYAHNYEEAALVRGANSQCKVQNFIFVKRTASLGHVPREQHCTPPTEARVCDHDVQDAPHVLAVLLRQIIRVRGNEIVIVGHSRGKLEGD